ncbi:MAG: cupin domain-containing protein [Janthinobacterium lividum]
MSQAETPIVVVESDVQPMGIKIEGSTKDGFDVQMLNIDPKRGVIATIIHIKPGSEIAAHFHKGGAEAHYVLDGDLVDAGRVCGPGSYLTHAAGVVHGPHSSVAGCRVLTIRDADFGMDDHHVVDGRPTRPGNDGASVGGTERTAEPQAAVPSSEKSAATFDNPVNPNSG